MVTAPVVMNMTTTKIRPCNHYRRAAPFGIVRRRVTKLKKQVKYPPKSLVGIVTSYFQISVVMFALRKEVIFMAKRRANGEGNIRKRKDGRWEGRYTAGTDPETGKQIFKNVLGKTQTEVKEKLKKALEEAKKVDFTRTGKYTVEQWMDEWFENVCKIKVRPSSHQTYRGYIDHHVAPNIGKIPLEKLSTMDLQKLYRKLMNKGRVERIEAEHQPKGLSAKTVRNINQVISSAMDFAVAQKILSENPCKAVALPKLEHKEMQTIPAEQLQAFLQEAKATGVYEMYYIELATGLRRGELLGLKWTDIDWKNGIIKVRRQIARVDGKIVESPLKTENSYRAVSISPLAIEVLQEQKKKTNDQYVFPSPNGGPISPDSVNNMLKRVLERAGIPKVRFHDLRHTFATIALQNGGRHQDCVRHAGTLLRRLHPGHLRTCHHLGTERSRPDHGKYPEYVNLALQPIEKPWTTNTSFTASLSNFCPDFPALESGK